MPRPALTSPLRAVRPLLVVAAVTAVAVTSACSGSDAPDGGSTPTESASQTFVPQFSNVDEDLGRSFEVLETARDIPLPADADNAGNVGELVAVKLDVEAGTVYDNEVFDPWVTFGLLAPDAEYPDVAYDGYDDIVEAAGYTPILPDEVEPGTTASGWIVIPVQERADTYELQYQRSEQVELGTDTTLPAVDLRVPLP
ncbi:hypothetical protein V5D56_06065 [Cellulosimicrobium sp. PMB13]|uniref:hypothetical protein n=1 Tax=Cellulosimicrobium sp. PMB13 TaxID=3120158 RepID=UPI003F4BD066